MSIYLHKKKKFFIEKNIHHTATLGIGGPAFRIHR
jgi:hypothetical protein